jgi:glycosyltransferase involved in cell wall biosynthesis
MPPPIPIAATGRHLAIDAAGVRPDSGGVVVLGDLLQAAAAHPSAPRITVFASRGVDLRLPIRPDLQRVICDAPSSRPRLLWWNAVGLERKAASLGADAILSVNGLGRSGALPLFLLFQQQLMFAPLARQKMGLSFRSRLALMTRLSIRACRQAEVVFVQAEHVRDNLLRHFRVPADRIHVVRPDVSWPVMSELPGSEREAGLITYVGSNRPHKSLDTLLRAFELARAQSPRLRLALTLPANVLPPQIGMTGLGRLERDAVRRLLRRAQVLVMPSLAETVGLPLLEAMDLGCAVVAADLPYAREVCGAAALYFPPGDAAVCAAQLLMLLQDDALRVALAEQARKRVEHRRACEPYKDLLDQLLLRLA